MADPTQADLQTELDEINDQLAGMVGSADISVGGLNIDESSLQKNLLERKASLEWRIKNMSDGGTSSSNVTGIVLAGGY